MALADAPGLARWIALLAAVALVASAANAAPRTYVLSGKFTSRRGPFFELPVVATAPCGGVGLSNLTVMEGPGGTMETGKPTPVGPFPARPPHPFGCVPVLPGKKITTTGAGVGGGFVMPTMVFSRPVGSSLAVVDLMFEPFLQLATNFQITGPRMTPTRPLGGSMVMNFPAAAFHGFKKAAWMTQTGRGASMFTWCFGNPACAKISQGTKWLLVRYSGGGSAFGGTMAYVMNAAPGSSSLAFAAGGDAVGFARFSYAGSQHTGRGYADYHVQKLAKGPIWADYMAKTVTRPNVGKQKLITMVTGFLGNNFPAKYNYAWGFPFTTMTVIVRASASIAGNPRVTTFTAKGGDTVTAMGRRNLSLVAGGVALDKNGPVIVSQPQLASMYLPEPSRAAQLAAGALVMFAIGVIRSRDHESVESIS